MDSKVLYELSKFLNKLDLKPIFQYFLKDEKFQVASNNGQFLYDLKQKVLLNQINSAEDIKKQLFNFYQQCDAAEGIQPIEHKSLSYLKKYTKEKFHKLKAPSLADWKTEWCKIYQNLALQLNSKNKASLQPMRLNTDSLPMCEDEMLKMSHKITHILNDTERSLLIDLISTLESGTTNLNNECTFDLHDLKDETLYAIKTFLTKIEDNSQEARFVRGDK